VKPLGSSAPPAPPDAQQLAGSVDGALATLERFADWLVGPGVERGLLGPREADRVWSRHVINCALVEPLIPATGSICDVGSGAGLPGIVVAALRPNQPVTLLEPLLRRSSFLAEVVDDLGLMAVTVVRARAEDYARERPEHGTVIARAVAPLGRLAGWCLPLVRPGGQLLAIKGDGAVTELSDAVAELEVMHVIEQDVVTVGEGGNVTHVVRVTRPRDPIIKPATEER
jgi:16S rRNA (guanine527-N7)-methyltransferase